MPYELIDHTADTGLDLEAADVKQLFSDAVDGMQCVLGLENVDPEETRIIRIDPASYDLMLVDLLREVLNLYNTSSFVVASVQVRELCEEEGVIAEATGEPYDADRHHPQTEIKGVTYHGLFVEKRGDTWNARVIFDL